MLGAPVLMIVLGLPSASDANVQAADVMAKKASPGVAAGVCFFAALLTASAQVITEGAFKNRLRVEQKRAEKQVEEEGYEANVESRSSTTAVPQKFIYANVQRFYTTFFTSTVLLVSATVSGELTNFPGVDWTCGTVPLKHSPGPLHTQAADLQSSNATAMGANVQTQHSHSVGIFVLGCTLLWLSEFARK